MDWYKIIILVKVIWQVTREWFHKIFNPTIFYKTLEQHQEDIRAIQNQIQTAPPQKRLSILRHDADTHCTRKQTYKTDCHLIDVSSLDKILEINLENNYLLCEPMCTMEMLAQELKQHGYSLPVVPEFKGITIGGTLAGGGLESTSFREGMMQNFMLEFSCILGNGEKITCSPTQNSDLFYGSMWALGTLGCLVSIKCKIIKRKDYVRLKYYHYQDRSSFTKSFQAKCRQSDSNLMFLEAVQVKQNKFVIICGYESERINLPLYQLTYWFSEWFCDHVERVPDQYEELMPLMDYNFRWDRGIFWLGKLKINTSFWKRFLFGWLFDMKTHHIYGRYKKDSKNEQNRLLADVGPPLDRLEEMIKYNDQEIGVYPIWMCPFKINHNKHHIFSPEITTILKLEFGG